MSPHRNNLPHHYLKPGEMHLGEEPALVSTLLGSCVAVTMFNPRIGLGAVCHGLLPACKGKASCTCDSSCLEGFRYVECSIYLMLDGFRRRGAAPGEIEVKVFGGADMFSLAEGKRSGFTVGRQNIETALAVIGKEGLRLIASDVGGVRGRKIFFYTHTGEVLLKRLRKSLDAQSNSDSDAAPARVTP